MPETQRKLNNVLLEHCCCHFVGVALDFACFEQTLKCKQSWIMPYCVHWADMLITVCIIEAEGNVSDTYLYM